MAMTNMLRGGRLVIGDHRQPRGHGFEYHIAKGFGQARKQEKVTAGIVFGQHLATLGAVEISRGDYIALLGAAIEGSLGGAASSGAASSRRMSY